MKNGAKITVDGNPEVVNLDFISRLRKDPETGLALLISPSGMGIKADQKFDVVAARLIGAGVAIDCTDEGQTV